MFRSWRESHDRIFLSHAGGRYHGAFVATKTAAVNQSPMFSEVLVVLSNSPSPQSGLWQLLSTALKPG
jgi:hypothetical protein